MNKKLQSPVGQLSLFDNEIDPQKHYLGKLCLHRHKYWGREQSVRYIKTNACVECQRSNQSAKYLRCRIALITGEDVGMPMVRELVKDRKLKR